MSDNPYMSTVNPYMETGKQASNPYMDLKEQRKPAPAMAEDMMSQIVGLDRPQPTPLKETHPNIYTAGKTALDMPGLIEKGAMAVISGATWGLPERAEEAGEYLARKLFDGGRKGGATGSWKEEPELHPYVEKGLEFVGQAMNIKTLGKVVAAPIIKSVMASKHFAPFARMVGWGAAGSTYAVGEQLVKEGELPTPKEIAKSGATWAAIEGVMSGLGWTGKLAMGLNRLSKTWTIPKKEVLKIVVKEAKLRKMPLANYIFTKAKVQKALGVKETMAAEQLLKVVDDTIKPFRKQGTYQSLAEQLKTEEITGRIKSFRKHVGETIVLGKKAEPGMITVKKASNIERALLKPGFRRTAEDVALINSTKPGLILPTPKTPPKPMKAFPKPAKAIAPPTEVSVEAAKHAEKIKAGFRPGKILAEDLPKWVKETEGKIRFGDSVTKTEIQKYQAYFKTKQKIGRGIAPGTPVQPQLPRNIKLPPVKRKPKPESGLKAALIYPNGKVVTGRSHLQCLEEAEKQGLDILAAGSAKPIKEGFVTSTGKFLTRKEAIQKFGTGESFRLQEAGIIAGKKKGTTLGFGPTAYLQNVYDKLIAKRLHKPLKKKLGDGAEHILSPTASKVMKAVKAAKPVRGKQEALYEIGRAKKLAKAMAVGKRTAGEHGYHAELAALKGKMEVAKYKSVRGVIKQDEVNTLMDEIKNCPVIGHWDAYPCRKGLAKMLDGTVPTEGEIRLLEDVFGRKFVGAVLKKRDLFKRLTELGIQAINFPKAIKASYDLSAPLRQGVFLLRRYKQWLPAFKDQFKYFGSKRAFEESQVAIRRHGNYKLATKNGLVLTDIKKGLTNREEAFQSPWAEKIPGIGASSRAYTGFLNQLRFDVFSDFVKKGRQLGLTKDPKYLKCAAKYINHATGRGHLLGMEGAATELNAVFFSPRLIMSRLQLVNPAFYVGLEKNVRKEALKDLFAFTGIAMTVGGLAKMAGLDVEVDPRSADFMKIKADSKRYDIMGGLQQVVKTSAQFLSGEVKSSTTGEVLTLGEGYKPLTRLGVASRFLQYKLSPVASFAVSLLTGQATMGGKVDIPVEIGRLFVPMAAEDMREIYDEEGLAGIPMAFPVLFGVGLQTYGGLTSFDLKGRDYPALNKELLRLKTSMGFPSTAAYGKELSGKEYRKFKTEAGRIIAKELTSTINKSFYKDVNDDAKRHIVDKTIDFNKEYVKRGMFPRYRLIQEQATKIRAATYVNVRKSREQAKKMLEKFESRRK